MCCSRAFELEGETYTVGDHVFIANDDDANEEDCYIARLEKLYEEGTVCLTYFKLHLKLHELQFAPHPVL